MEHDLFQVATKALVYNSEGKLLLLRDHKNEWDLPGGRIHHNESFESALRREIKEEVGVEVVSVSAVPKFVWPYTSATNIRIDLCFEVTLASHEFVQTDENQESGYFNLEEIKQLKLCPHLESIKEWIK